MPVHHAGGEAADPVSRVQSTLWLGEEADMAKGWPPVTLGTFSGNVALLLGTLCSCALPTRRTCSKRFIHLLGFTFFQAKWRTMCLFMLFNISLLLRKPQQRPLFVRSGGISLNPSPCNQSKKMENNASINSRCLHPKYA